MPLPESDLNFVLESLRAELGSLRNARIFLTGGTGFFGKWLVETLLWANARLDLGIQAVLLTRDPDGFRERFPHLGGHPSVTLHPGDVRSYGFPDGDFSHVIHGATDVNISLHRQYPLLMLDTIVQGARRTLDFAVASHASKFLFISSGAVYGKQASELTHMPETCTSAPDPMDPLAANGEGKRLVEFLCAAYHRQHGLETKIARCFAFVGPYLPLDFHFAIGNFIRDAMLGGPIQVSGDGTPYRSYLYAADLAVWLWTILLRGESCTPYNVGSECEVTIAELARQVSQVVNPAAKISIAAHPTPGHKPARYVPLTELAQEELGLRETVSLAESIRRTAQWHGWSR